MRLILCFLAVFTTACSALDAELRNAIAFGEIRELNQYSPGVDKALLVRMFQAPVYREGCFRETHGICQFRYFISVATYDEDPDTNLFELEIPGDVITVDWVAAEGVDTAVIDLTLNEYTAEALANNPSLKNHPRKVRLAITPSGMQATEIRAAQ